MITAAKRRYSLSELCAQMTAENRHGEIDSGPPVGREFGAEGWNDIEQEPGGIGDGGSDG